MPGGQLAVPVPTPPGTTVKGADVTVWTFVPRTPLNPASACFDLRSAFLAVFRARLATFTGLAELKASGPPDRRDRVRQSEDHGERRYRERDEPAHLSSPSLADCKLPLRPRRANNLWMPASGRGLDDRTPGSFSAPVGVRLYSSAPTRSAGAIHPCRSIHARLPCRLLRVLPGTAPLGTIEAR